MAQLLWSLLGIVSGALIAFQAPINSQLSRGLGMPLAAACISFVTGAVVLLVASLLISRIQGVTPNFRAPAPWLFLVGGLLGAVYVTTAIFLTPVIGAAALMAFLMTGQLLTSLFLDRVGFLGMAMREISVGRITGAILLLAGALMIRFT
jgi:transporter family-2 protein